MKKYKCSILGLDSYGITLSDLKDISNKKVEFQASCIPKYSQSIFKLKPSERLARIDKIGKDALLKLLKKFPLKGEIKKGHVHYSSSVSELLNLKKCLEKNSIPGISHIYVTNIKGLKKIKHPYGKVLFNVIARKQISVEGNKKSDYEYELTHTLVRAKDENEAKKVFTKIQNLTKPYVNTDGFKVKWELDKILEINEVFGEWYDLDEIGIETYSKISSKKSH